MAAILHWLTGLMEPALRLVGRPFPRYALALALSGAIFLASSRSSLPVPIQPGMDKVIHLLTYLALGLSYLNVTTSGLRLSTPGRLALAWLAGLAFALSDEWHQTMVPGRTAEWGDLLADGLGVSLAVGLLGWMKRKL